MHMSTRMHAHTHGSNGHVYLLLCTQGHWAGLLQGVLGGLAFSCASTISNLMELNRGLGLQTGRTGFGKEQVTEWEAAEGGGAR